MSYSRWGNAWSPGAWSSAWGQIASGDLSASSLVVLTAADSPELLSIAALLTDGLVVPVGAGRPDVSQLHVIGAQGIAAEIDIDEVAIESIATLVANQLSLESIIGSAIFAQQHGLSVANLSAQSITEIAEFLQDHGLSADSLLSATTIGAPIIVLNTTRELLELRAELLRQLQVGVRMDRREELSALLQRSEINAAQFDFGFSESVGMDTALQIIAFLQEERTK
jgi:hypothetical protein